MMQLCDKPFWPLASAFEFQGFEGVANEPLHRN
jgi:hypothetical protein